METLARTTALFITLVLASCGGGGGGSVNGAFDSGNFCADINSRQNLLTTMQDVYLWYDKLPTLDLNDNRYCSLATLLEDLRYKQEDRFSVIRLKTVNDAFFEQGTYQGFGFGFRADSNGDVAITYVYTNSPAGNAGVQRADKILAINGANTAGLSVQAVSDLIGVAANSGSANMQLQAPNAAARNVTISLGLVTINTVLDTRVINHNGLKIGYLSFVNFIRPSVVELEAAFSTLKAANVDELVLDLRYNSGGYIFVSAILASLTAGQVANNSVFTTLRFNDKYSNSNQDHFFQQKPSSINNLSRVFILTLPGTCSASELIINGLRPWLGSGSVITVGGTTCGKPFGSSGITISANGTDGSTREYSLAALTFRSVNSLGQGDYINGITADCPSVDDLTHGFGETSEGMLATALAFIDNGRCVATPRVAAQGIESTLPYRVNDAY